jgi:hypothetical protein
MSQRRHNRRHTIASGLSGKQRRRLARRMRDVTLGRGPGCYARYDCEVRDARRLHEAGLACAVVSKGGFIGRREIALCATRERAVTRYGRERIMR